MEDPNMTISGPEVGLSPVAGDLLMVPFRKIKSVTLVIGAIEKLKLIVLPQIFNLRSDKSRQFFMIKTG